MKIIKESLKKKKNQSTSHGSQSKRVRRCAWTYECRCSECVRAAYARESECVVYLVECEARLRTTVKEVLVSYRVEGEPRRACVPLRESRIEYREPRLLQVGCSPIRSIRETHATDRHHKTFSNQTSSSFTFLIIPRLASQSFYWHSYEIAR